MLDLLLKLFNWFLQLDMHVPKLSMLYGFLFPLCEELGVMHGVFAL
jgi:hypothetical protein